MPLVARDSGIPYGLLPTRADLALVTARLRDGLTAAGLAVVPGGPAVAHSKGAAFVVTGGVERAMAVVWASDFTVSDPRNGRVLGRLNAGFKGDVTALALAARESVGPCLARIIENRPRCKTDPGF